MSPKKQTCLSSKTKEMLISPDFCDICGISAEPLVLAQLPVNPTAYGSNYWNDLKSTWNICLFFGFTAYSERS